MWVTLYGAPEKCFTQVSSSLTHNYFTRLKKFSDDKHSSLLRTFVNYGRKKFCSIGPWSFIKVGREATLRKNCELGQKCFMRLVQEENWFKKCLNDSLSCSMDKLKLARRNLGQVFNYRLGHAWIGHAIVLITKQPNLKLKTQPKQLLGSLPLAFALPRCSLETLKAFIWVCSNDNTLF